MFYLRHACLLYAAAAMLVGTAVGRPVPEMSVLAHHAATADVDHVAARAAAAADVYMLYRRATHLEAAQAYREARGAVLLNGGAWGRAADRESDPAHKTTYRNAAEEAAKVSEVLEQKAEDHEIAHRHPDHVVENPGDSYNFAKRIEAEARRSLRSANSLLSNARTA